MERGTQKEVFNFRLSKSDKEKMKADSKKTGLPMAKYLRRLINNRSPVPREDYMAIKELTNEVNAIGNNINQIARNFNSGFFDESEKKHLISLMEELAENTGKIARGIKPEKGDH